MSPSPEAEAAPTARSPARKRQRLPRRRRGSMALEFALVAPILCLFSLASADVVRYVRTVSLVERSAGEIANILAQSQVLNEADVSAIIDAAAMATTPHNVTGPSGRVILSGLSRAAGVTRVVWQRQRGGLSAASQLGVENSTASLPNGFALEDGQTAVAAEVIFEFQPWIFATGFVNAPTNVLRAWGTSLMRPRGGALDAITP